jgi:predicted AlkP superfamily phosphohydrolase/phosphomutase
METTVNHDKVSMIGLDGATFALLKPLMEDGVMPFLRRFVQEGVHGDLLSTRNPLTPPAWISMITGRSPHVHGIYDFLRPATLEDGSVFLKVNDSRYIRSEAIWSIAQRHGRRATSLNFYGMSPPPPIDGYLISGFVPWKHLRHAMYPAGLFDTIKQMPDFDYKSLAMDIGEEKKCVQGLLEGEHEDWIKLQSDRDTAWAQICCRLMERDRTELTAVVMDGPDKIQHLFWRFVDPALQPANPDPWFTRIRGLCLDFYRQLDANIERLVRAAGPDTDVIMTSDHGFGATTEVVYINEWLARHGYLRWRSSVEQGEAGKLTADRMKEHLGMVDWRNSVAYCPTPSSNAIYIKRVNGASPGVKDTEYLEFCLKLRQQLLDFRDPANGKPVFVGVDVNKLEGTPYVEPSPDITVRLRDGGFVSILKSNDIVVPREHPDGTHRPNGIFIARGPRIRRGAHTKPLNLLDIAPLLLHLLGIPIPDDLEGRVPTEVLTDTASGQRSVARGNATVATATHDGERQPTPEEREALLKQLKLLGYMD